MGTIKTFVGTPIDISCFNAFGTIPTATGNWVAVLEDNGDNTWQVALFGQDEALINRLSPALPGTPIALDVDTTNHLIHVWIQVGSTLQYTILGYS